MHFGIQHKDTQKKRINKHPKNHISQKRKPEKETYNLLQQNKSFHRHTNRRKIGQFPFFPTLREKNIHNHPIKKSEALRVKTKMNIKVNSPCKYSPLHPNEIKTVSECEKLLNDEEREEGFLLASVLKKKTKGKKKKGQDTNIHSATVHLKKEG